MLMCFEDCVLKDFLFCVCVCVCVCVCAVWLKMFLRNRYVCGRPIKTKYEEKHEIFNYLQVKSASPKMQFLPAYFLGLNVAHYKFPSSFTFF